MRLHVLLQGANLSPTAIVIGPYDTTVAGQVISEVFLFASDAWFSYYP